MTLPPLAPEQRIKPWRFETRVGLLYLGLFLTNGVHLPFFPLWLETAGFDAVEIAVIVGAPLIMRVIAAPFISAYADRIGDRAHVLILLAAGSVLLSLGFFLEPTYLIVLSASLGLSFFWSPQNPIIDSVALSGVRRFGSDYTAMRIWGSWAFLLANLAGGLILSFMGAGYVPVMVTAGFSIFLATCIAAPRLGRPRVSAQLPLSEFGAAGTAVFSGSIILMIFGAGMINGAHGFQYAFVSIYWGSLGLSEGVIGLLWACGVVAEIALFLVFSRLFGRLSAATTLVISGVGSVLRWLAFPLIWPAGLGVPGFLLMQVAHAVSFGFMLLGLQKLIVEAIPDARTGAAQGMALFANSICLVLVTLASGYLYEQFGAGAYFVMAAIAFAGLVMVVAGARSAPK